MGYAFRAAQILSSQSASGVNRLVGRLLLPLVLFRVRPAFAPHTPTQQCVLFAHCSTCTPRPVGRV